jgi:hypothetical protein
LWTLSLGGLGLVLGFGGLAKRALMERDKLARKQEAASQTTESRPKLTPPLYDNDADDPTMRDMIFGPRESDDVTQD